MRFQGGKEGETFALEKNVVFSKTIAYSASQEIDYS